MTPHRGTAANDTLLGGPGSDRMRGDAVDDTYVIDDADEIKKRLVYDGVDTVQTSVSYELDGHQENLILLGRADLSGTGNTSANVLCGNSDANTLHPRWRDATDRSQRPARGRRGTVPDQAEW